MNDKKLQAYSITFIDNEGLEKMNSVVITAYNKEEAMLILQNAPYKRKREVIGIRKICKCKKNARWFTREIYEHLLEATGLDK